MCIKEPLYIIAAIRSPIRTTIVLGLEGSFSSLRKKTKYQC
jgi:hypothetical protein